MPYRKIVFADGRVYHTINRGIAKEHVFLEARDYQRMLEVIDFYKYTRPPIRFSYYNRQPLKKRQKFIEGLKKNHKPLVEIIAFCLMPNHAHFLLRQLQDRGVPTFMRNIQNSYAKFFNTKYKRIGALFQAMFKAVKIESNEQLLHVSRYIHLNPATSYLIKVDELTNYLWSSLSEYLDSQSSEITTPNMVLGQFKSGEDYLKFVIDQADYQRKLQRIKQLILEKEP